MLGPLCEDARVELIGDAAQSFGAAWRGQSVGSLCRITTTSFFPAKPLGCYGDGGAILTDDGELAGRLRLLRVHGQGADKYDNVLIGLNSRLDTLQAAVLLAKLEIFDEELAARQEVAGALRRTRCEDWFARHMSTSRATSVWAQYTIEANDRDALASALRSEDIPTAVYYRAPLHQQTAYRRFPRAAEALAVAETASGRVLSLPMHPYLDEVTQELIAKSVAAAEPS